MGHSYNRYSIVFSHPHVSQTGLMGMPMRNKYCFVKATPSHRRRNYIESRLWMLGGKLRRNTESNVWKRQLKNSPVFHAANVSSCDSLRSCPTASTIVTRIVTCGSLWAELALRLCGDYLWCCIGLAATGRRYGTPWSLCCGKLCRFYKLITQTPP